MRSISFIAVGIALLASSGCEKKVKPPQKNKVNQLQNNSVSKNSISSTEEKMSEKILSQKKENNAYVLDGDGEGILLSKIKRLLVQFPKKEETENANTTELAPDLTNYTDFKKEFDLILKQGKLVEVLKNYQHFTKRIGSPNRFKEFKKKYLAEYDDFEKEFYILGVKRSNPTLLMKLQARLEKNLKEKKYTKEYAVYHNNVIAASIDPWIEALIIHFKKDNTEFSDFLIKLSTQQDRTKKGWGERLTKAVTKYVDNHKNQGIEEKMIEVATNSSLVKSYQKSTRHAYYEFLFQIYPEERKK